MSRHLSLAAGILVAIATGVSLIVPSSPAALGVFEAAGIAALKPYDISNKAPLWWGQLLMALIEASMFLMLLVMYFYMRLSVDVWPPPGTQIPHVTWPTIALIMLIVSAVGLKLIVPSEICGNVFWFSA